MLREIDYSTNKMKTRVTFEQIHDIVCNVCNRRMAKCYPSYASDKGSFLKNPYMSALSSRSGASGRATFMGDGNKSCNCEVF